MRCYNLLLLKAYFDCGLGLTNYVKYFIAAFGLYSFAEKIDLRITILATFIYAVFCFILGWLWYKFRLIDTTIEIQNRFNPFVGEMREKIIKRKI